jgi:hypothetical protein
MGRRAIHAVSRASFRGYSSKTPTPTGESRDDANPIAPSHPPPPTSPQPPKSRATPSPAATPRELPPRLRQWEAPFTSRRGRARIRSHPARRFLAPQPTHQGTRWATPVPYSLLPAPYSHSRPQPQNPTPNPPPRPLSPAIPAPHARKPMRRADVYSNSKQTALQKSSILANSFRQFPHLFASALTRNLTARANPWRPRRTLEANIPPSNRTSRANLSRSPSPIATRRPRPAGISILLYSKTTTNASRETEPVHPLNRGYAPDPKDTSPCRSVECSAMEQRRYLHLVAGEARRQTR